jgi:rod shape determining protein RodA
MATFRKRLDYLDLPLLLVTLILVTIGVLAIYSSGVSPEGVLVSTEFAKQLVWAATGLVLMVLVTLPDHKQIKDYSLFIYIFFLAVLLVVSFTGRLVNGARSWIRFGALGVQPSEFMKVATILFLANYLAESTHESSLRRLLVSLAIVMVPVILIFPQQDFGTALVFFPILLFMVFVAGVDRRYLLFALVGTALAGVLTVLPLWGKFILKSEPAYLYVLYKAPWSYLLTGTAAAIAALATWGRFSFKKRHYAWIAYGASLVAASLAASTLAHLVLKEYQVMRLIVFLDPSVDPRGSGWNIVQSLNAIGSGGFFGKGFLLGTQSHLHYLPQQSTDFIFSMIAEEWGFVGGFAVFALYFVLFGRCIQLIRIIDDRYANYVTAGILGMILFHFMINSGMVMGIMPVTGIPLMFLSYGGSSLWTGLVSVGLLLGISMRRYRN